MLTLGEKSWNEEICPLYLLVWSSFIVTKCELYLKTPKAFCGVVADHVLEGKKKGFYERA